MSNKLWKSSERRIAALLGGERVPITGRVRGSEPDVKHPTLSIEVKQKEALPKWLYSAMEQAEMSIRGEQTPIVVLHQTGDRYEDAFVVIKLSDFISFLE